MFKKQQKQTLKYFDKIYLDWHKRAIFNKKNKFDTINERNNYALNFIKKLKIKKHLDLGCGSGELINSSSKFTRKSVGIDFSSKMILLAKKKYKESVKKKFISIDIKRYLEDEKEYFDLISANGFFEYFSFSEMQTLFKKTNKKLNKNGYFVASFRNRLFNIFSLNKFTSNELKLKNANSLIEESILLNNSKLSDLIKNKKYHFKNLKKISQPETGGVKVETRHQYTPIEIIAVLKKYGFTVKNIFPINLHLLNPKIKEKEIIEKLKLEALRLYNDGNYNSLLLQASTFMVLAKKN